MIQSMGYFEIFYMGQLRKNRINLERYKENFKNKDKLDLTKKVLFKADESKIRALIKTNEGRKSMREALGMELELDPATAIKRFWYLGELLELGVPEKVEISKEMKERAEIIKRYQKALTDIKKKLEEDKKDKEKKQKN